jgi:ubiquinone/menaquinone biosynthesis C-methylase UbiE
LFKKLLDNTDPKSLANKFRINRFKHFAEFIKDTPRPLTILDVGGTADFWKQMGLEDKSEYQVTILNLEEPLAKQLSNLKFIQGDASDLSQFGNISFDVVFSNSVIEHIPSKVLRQKMADEITRVGKKYFVQTPSFYFPFEPHFLFPCFQYFPARLQLWLLQHFSMGWFKKCSSKAEASELLRNNSLLKESEFRSYFSNCRIIKEKFLLLTKSYIALGAVNNNPSSRTL